MNLIPYLIEREETDFNDVFLDIENFRNEKIYQNLQIYDQ